MPRPLLPPVPLPLPLLVPRRPLPGPADQQGPETGRLCGLPPPGWGPSGLCSEATQQWTKLLQSCWQGSPRAAGVAGLLRAPARFSKANSAHPSCPCLHPEHVPCPCLELAGQEGGTKERAAQKGCL